MRILWLGNPPWLPTGYGQQAALTIPRLQAAGHEVVFLCNWGLNGHEMVWDGTVCFPTDGQWGNTSLGAFAEAVQPDLVIALCDAWVLRPDVWPDDLEVAVWAPVDHQPAPPAVVQVLSHPKVRPVAMSRFGSRMMRDAGLDPVYIPHMVDTTMFRPQPELRGPVRGELGIPDDAFLVGMVGQNTGCPIVRKAFPQAFQAFAALAARHDDAWLYAHADVRPDMGGIALDTLAAATGCPPGRIWFPGPATFRVGVPAQTVAHLYQAFDVLLMPSLGEGFGIPLIEAQACGVPVITSNHSAMPELCDTGWLVQGDPWWDAMQSSFFHMPHLGSIVDCLEHAYQARGDRQLRDRAVRFAANYDADKITNTHWRPALEQLAGREMVAA